MYTMGKLLICLSITLLGLNSVWDCLSWGITNNSDQKRVTTHKASTETPYTLTAEIIFEKTTKTTPVFESTTETTFKPTEKTKQTTLEPTTELITLSASSSITNPTTLSTSIFLRPLPRISENWVWVYYAAGIVSATSFLLFIWMIYRRRRGNMLQFYQNLNFSRQPLIESATEIHM